MTATKYNPDQDPLVVVSRLADQTIAERDEARRALRDIRDEISHGATANWEFIELRLRQGLGE